MRPPPVYKAPGSCPRTTLITEEVLQAGDDSIWLGSRQQTRQFPAAEFKTNLTSRWKGSRGREGRDRCSVYSESLAVSRLEPGILPPNASFCIVFREVKNTYLSLGRTKTELNDRSIYQLSYLLERVLRSQWIRTSQLLSTVSNCLSNNKQCKSVHLIRTV
ncbi:hypothetical protein BDN67DRAFT_633376 [Paxillus ammoniavirescens]|nr:hypothetical protein BDN67DRAFT_633376 [Paxillus ammoniavirescens]